MEIILSVALIGILSACITEILKIVPFFKETKERKRILALIVSVIATGIYGISSGDLEGVSLVGGLIGVLGSSLITYKGVIKAIIPSGK